MEISSINGGSNPSFRSKKCAFPIQCSVHGLDKNIAYRRIGVRYDVQFKGVLQYKFTKVPA